MRILAVSHTAVWPVRSGSANRRLMTLRALARLGRVDLLYVGEVEDYASWIPDDAPIEECWAWPVARVRPGLAVRTAWLLNPSVPYQMIEWADPRGVLPCAASYDLIWYFRPVAYELARGVAGTRRVVDLDDLEDEKLRQARTTRKESRRFRRRLAERRNAVAWKRYQRTIAERMDVVTVCKTADCHTLSVSNCMVVPNGFPEAGVVSGGLRQPPVLLFVGLFSYGPNADAAEFFVDEVFPRISARLPDAEVRLVGRNAERVRRLAQPGVEVVGEVEDLTAEYDRASVAVVPIRIQSGTRVKILEAFARGVPVVSTGSGAAGLGAEDGKHLLLADDAETFAEACVSLANSESLRSTLTGAALSLYRSRYGQAAVTEAVRAVVERASPLSPPTATGGLG